MVEKRVIHIHPDLFLNTTKKNRGKDKIKIKGPVKPPKKASTLKKGHLLKMIRERQENLFNKKYGEIDEAKKQEPTVQEFNKDFQEAQNYFENLLKKEEEEKKAEREREKQNNFLHNHTIKQYPASSPLPSYQPNNPTNCTTKPEYGCMKNGSLPTYRNFMNKTRSNQLIPIQIQEEIQDQGQGQTQQSQQQSGYLEGRSPGSLYPPSPNIPSPVSSFVSSMTSIPYPIPTSENNTLSMKPPPLSITESMSIMDNSDKNGNRSMMESIKQFSKHPFQNKMREHRHPTKQKKTIRRTYRVGKSKVFSRVSVLISNKTIRNNVTTKTQMMKTLPIQEIKRYLVKHGLIKIGSNTPNDILRKMYESASLVCGEVFNHNPDNLLHNFINGSEE